MDDLIKRLQEAEAGSRELDIAVMREAGLSMSMIGLTVPSYTTSLDAIVALIGEKIGGGYRIDHSDGPDGRADVWIWFPGNSSGGVHGEAWTAPAAACVALLSAIRQQEGGEHG